MLGGEPWFKSKPILLPAPRESLWRIHPRNILSGENNGVDNNKYAISANTFSKARLALRGTHGMFYAAESLEAALWEYVLRNCAFTTDRRVTIEVRQLEGLLASQVQLVAPEPGLLMLHGDRARPYFGVDSPQEVAMAKLLTTTQHAETYAEAEELRKDLARVGISDLPIYGWHSRMFPRSLVYLAYSPPMAADWWRHCGPAVALGNDDETFDLLEKTLARSHLTLNDFVSSPTLPITP